MMNTNSHTTEKTNELPALEEWDDGRLPLVLLTVGKGIGEFARLYDHLETIAQDPAPRQQSLIVARPGTPRALYHSLRARTREMPNVHIRRLDDDIEDCMEFAHQTGTFYATRPKSEGGT